jgi:hypothetical protein
MSKLDEIYDRIGIYPGEVVPTSEELRNTLTKEFKALMLELINSSPKLNINIENNIDGEWINSNKLRQEVDTL